MGEAHAIVLFDGICGLCDRSVNFIIEHDRSGYFQFAPLQSDFGRQRLAEYRLDPNGINTVVLIEGSRAFVRSAAALRIARRLRFPISLLAVFLLVPPPLRDLVYDWIARNRYRWFGKLDACRRLATEVVGRFLG